MLQTFLAGLREIALQGSLRLTRNGATAKRPDAYAANRPIPRKRMHMPKSCIGRGILPIPKKL